MMCYNSLMDNATDFEKGWLIGIIEGEGCFYLQVKNGVVRSRQIRVKMADDDTIARLHALVPGSHVHGPRQEGTRKTPMYVWETGKWAIVEPLLRLVQPHLSARRRAQAQALLDNPPRRRCPA